MATPTVCEYVLQRLCELGIDRVFGVPGDYAFPIDDAIEASADLEWIICANELNAAYAADGYARRRGAAILTTTYGVGELSAVAGVMGSKAHRLPVFHIVGAPSLRIQKQRLVTHHSLGDGVYGNFIPISAATACVSAELTADNAIDELERVIREALRLSAPAYINVPEDIARMPVLGKPIKGQKLSSLVRHVSVPAEREAALKAALERLHSAKTPVILVSSLVKRFGLQEKLAALLDKSGIPFALSPMDRGTLDESHPGFLGIYNGDASFPKHVQQRVEQADLVLDAGGLILEDLNSGFWTDRIFADRVITLGSDFVRAGDDIFTSVVLGDMLDGLSANARPMKRPDPAPFELLPMQGAANDRLASTSFYPRLQRMLRAGDIVVGETGSCIIYLAAMSLPKGVGYEAQTLWGSIGWATPAAMGIAMADLARRVILITGDGSHQLTANEIGVMGRYGIKPVIFVLNNGLFGIEDILSERGHIYDDIARWNYHTIPAAMGCKGWFTARVTTVRELEQAIASAQSHDGACYIEVVIPEKESQPLSRSTVDRIYKTNTPGSRTA